MNVKLAGDLKVAQIDNMKSKTLEYQLFVVMQKESRLQESLQNAETMLRNKGIEELTATQTMKEDEQRRSLKHHQEVAIMKEKLRNSMEVQLNFRS